MAANDGTVSTEDQWVKRADPQTNAHHSEMDYMSYSSLPINIMHFQIEAFAQCFGHNSNH